MTNVTDIAEIEWAAKNTRFVFDYLEANTIIDVGKTAEAFVHDINAASAVVKCLVGAEMLRQTTDTARSQTLTYEKYFLSQGILLHALQNCHGRIGIVASSNESVRTDSSIQWAMSPKPLTHGSGL